MKLNLASGLHPTDLPDWVNVDLPWRGVKDPHVFADGFALPFLVGSFDAVYLGHVLEHIDWELLPDLGCEVRRVLRPMGDVMAVGPDIVRAERTGQPEWLLDAIRVLDVGPGGHKWVADESSTVAACRLMGFRGVAPCDVAGVTAPEWPNPSCADWQCAVVAVAP